MQTCTGKTKTGAPCRAAAGPTGFCFFHANPDQARALGQVGGRRNRQQTPEPLAMGTLTAADLTSIIGQTICDVRARTVTPHVAAAIAQLCNVCSRLTPVAELEVRLARLEKKLSDREIGSQEATAMPAAQASTEEDAPTEDRSDEEITVDYSMDGDAPSVSEQETVVESPTGESDEHYDGDGSEDDSSDGGGQ